MGKASRLKRARRQERIREQMHGPPLRREALSILRGIHQTIQGHCHESGRRCWEYLLEMLAQVTGWKTESSESEHLWEPMRNHLSQFIEFIETWVDEVQEAADSGTAFSEPLGELLELIEGTNENLAQFFTPMSVVRTINQMSMPERIELDEQERPTKRGLDPACGTGRFAIDALVHNPGLLMHSVDLDPWLLRAAKINARILNRWTSTKVATKDLLKPLNRDAPPLEGKTLILGGRALFIHGDALRVDMTYQKNWLAAPWNWAPLDWREHLKINNYYGTLQEWEDEGRPPLLKDSERPIKYDISTRSKESGRTTLEDDRGSHRPKGTRVSRAIQGTHENAQRKVR